MAFSIKKRVKSKLNISSVSDDDAANALGEVLHRSTKTSKSKKDKKKNNQFLQPISTCNPDSDLDFSSRFSSVERKIVYRSECPCETHYDKQLIEHNYDVTVDKLLDLTFGTNEFVRTYRQAQNIYDDTATEWTMNEETKCRERVLNYKIPYDSTLVGKGTISTREKQTLTHEVTGSHYVLDAEIRNDGVKYSDTFSLCMRYCLVQTSATTTHFRVTAHVRFCKPVNSLLKPLIERNTYSSSLEGLKDLNNRLSLVTNFAMKKRRQSRGEVSSNVPVLTNNHDHRLSRHDALSVTPLHHTLSDDRRALDQSTNSSYHPAKLMYMFIFITGVLLLIHIYLYLKLKHMDILIDHLAHIIKISSSISSAKQ